jgi:hypothetical protein
MKFNLNKKSTFVCLLSFAILPCFYAFFEVKEYSLIQMLGLICLVYLYLRILDNITDMLTAVDANWNHLLILIIFVYGIFFHYGSDINNLFNYFLIYYSSLFIFSFIVANLSNLRNYIDNNCITTKHDFLKKNIYDHSIYFLAFSLIYLLTKLYFFLNLDLKSTEYNELYLSFLNQINPYLRDIVNNEKLFIYPVYLKNSFFGYLGCVNAGLGETLYFAIFIYLTLRFKKNKNRSTKNRKMIIFSYYIRKKLLSFIFLILILDTFIKIIILLNVQFLVTENMRILAHEFTREVVSAKILYLIILLFFQIVLFLGYLNKSFRNKIYNEIYTLIIKFLFLMIGWFTFFMINKTLNPYSNEMIKNLFFMPSFLILSYFTISLTLCFINITKLTRFIVFFVGLLFFIIFIVLDIKNFSIYFGFILFLNISINTELINNIKKHIKEKLYI